MLQFAPNVRRTDIVVQEFDNEILIYDLSTNKVFNLNQTSAMIWQLSNGNKTISEIAHDLTQKLNSAINEEFVWLALDQFRNENLIDNGHELSLSYKGTSRREVIRRAGLASFAALPVIYSLLAPTAVSAQSTCTNNMAPLGCPCGSNNECINFCCGLSLTCVPTGLLATGSPCRVNCECASGLCPAAPGTNMCV